VGDAFAGGHFDDDDDDDERLFLFNFVSGHIYILLICCR
jgi:hypothetical protein